METLRKLFKDKDKPFIARLTIMALLGVAMLVASSLFLNGDKEAKKMDPAPAPVDDDKATARGGSYENDLENRLSALLSQVDGAGKVDVMITLSNGSEIILAEDNTTNETWVKETDSAGGERENRTKAVESSTILLQGAASAQEPLIVKEIVPKVEGVIIVAEGGGDILIKEALMNAAKTVLGVELHKVQVLKMKN